MRRLLKYSFGVVHTPPPSSLQCYTQRWKLRQFPWLYGRTTHFTGCVLWEISSVCVVAVKLRGIETTYIINGDRGRPRVSSYCHYLKQAECPGSTKLEHNFGVLN